MLQQEKAFSWMKVSTMAFYNVKIHSANDMLKGSVINVICNLYIKRWCLS